jgi:hypothetical protein
MVMGLRHFLIERQASQFDGHRTVSLWPNSWHKMKGIFTATSPGIHPQNPRTGVIFTTLVKIQTSPDEEEVARCLDNEFVAGEEVLCREGSIRVVRT